MAISKVPANSVLQLELHTGVNIGGSPIYRHKSFSNIKSTATDQDMYDVALALADLQEHPLNGIARIDGAQLVQD